MSAELSCFVPGLFDSMEVMRAKRTKRLSMSSSFGYGGASALTSSSGSEDRDGGKEDLRLVSSATVSGEEEEENEEEEEEDMANCLILLAQGHGSTQLDRLDDKSGFYVYECKTCNRTFPSFQSLGGHRASHKRPKQTAMGGEKKASSYTLEALQFNRNSYTHPPTSKGSPINKGKIHECSICGLEFTSGQALGGHMRRHRATSTGESRSNVGQTPVGMEPKQRNLLQLDLNMPAPEEDLRDSKFQFVRTQQPLVFSTPALVHCHY